MNPELLTKAKSLGFSDRQIAHLTGKTEDEIRAERKRLGLVPSYRLVDTCAAEFEAYTPYFYSTYDCGDDEIKTSSRTNLPEVSQDFRGLFLLSRRRSLAG